jgi:hypothetical protein
MSQTEFQLPFEGDLFSGFKGIAALSALKTKLIHVIETKLGEYTTNGIKLPPKDEFLANAKTFFETTLAKIDIPGIGPVVEGALKQAAVNGLMTLAALAYDRIAPVPAA